ncbi:Putative ribonuclease H protein At1g65750 [Linum perenne]
MLKGARAAIRDGYETRFWTTKWADSGDCLIDLIDETHPIPNLNDCVTDFVTQDDQWDVTKLSQALPQDAVSLVIGMSPPRADRGEDLWVWGGEKSGQFSIKSAYQIICEMTKTPNTDPWRPVWNWKGPNRIRHFLWFVAHQKILTNVGWVSRHLTNDATCEHCRTGDETVLHVLRDCQAAADVWNQVGGIDTSCVEWSSELVPWLCFLLNSEQSTLFGIVCWLLWKARNARAFTNERPTPISVVIRSQFWR